MKKVAKVDSVYFRRRSCTGKQNHRDPIWALVATVMIQRRHGDGYVFAYKCRFCPNYHVGHIHYRIREFVGMMVDAVDAVMAEGRKFKLVTMKKRA